MLRACMFLCNGDAIGRYRGPSVRKERGLQDDNAFRHGRIAGICSSVGKRAISGRAVTTYLPLGPRCLDGFCRHLSYRKSPLCPIE